MKFKHYLILMYTVVPKNYLFYLELSFHLPIFNILLSSEIKYLT